MNVRTAFPRHRRNETRGLRTSMLHDTCTKASGHGDPSLNMKIAFNMLLLSIFHTLVRLLPHILYLHSLIMAYILSFFYEGTTHQNHLVRPSSATFMHVGWPGSTPHNPHTQTQNHQKKILNLGVICNFILLKKLISLHWLIVMADLACFLVPLRTRKRLLKISSLKSFFYLFNLKS